MEKMITVLMLGTKTDLLYDIRGGRRLKGGSERANKADKRGGRRRRKS